MCDSILLGSVCIISLDDGLCLVQVKQPVKPFQNPVSKKKTVQKPIPQDIQKNIQKPVREDDPFFFGGPGDGQPRNRAASNPTAAAGILLFSPDSLNSPNFSPNSLLISILIGPFLILF